LIGREPEGLKCAFIPTAGDPYGPIKPWMHADRAKLVEMGLKVTNFDLKRKTESKTRESLSQFDVIFVAGGNTFYLLNWARKSGFAKVAKELVAKGKIYIGSSAGSILIGPDIISAGWGTESGWGDDNFLNMKDTTGIELVNFSVYPHFTEDQRKLMETNAKVTEYPIIAITDQQMVVVDDEDYKIVGRI